MATSFKHFHVDRSLIPAKLAYFFNSARAGYQPFILIFLNEIGLDTTKAGFINGLHYLGFLFGGPILAYIADRYKRHLEVARITTILGLVFMIIAPTTSILISKALTNSCPINELTNKTSINENTNGVNNESLLFFQALLLFTLASMFGDGIRGFIDIAVLQKTAKYNNYSHQILFRSFGWSFSIFLAGVLIDHFPTIKATCYTGAFVSVSLNTIGLIIAVEFLLRGVTFSDTTKSETSNLIPEISIRMTTWQILKDTLRKPKYILFFTIVSLMGTLHGIHFNFYFLFFKNIGASQTFMTMYSVATGVLCTISYILFNQVLVLVRGIWVLFLLTALANVLRFFVFGISSNLYLVFSTVLSVPLNSMFQVAMVRYVKQEFPDEIQTTVLNITNALFQAFGCIISNMAGGAIYKIYGKEVLFFSCTVLAVFLCFLNLVIVVKKCRYN